MPRALHLLKRDSPAIAVAAIAATATEPDVQATVVLLDDVAAPALPPGLVVRRLGTDVDHAGLLDLIFSHDQVVTW